MLSKTTTNYALKRDLDVTNHYDSTRNANTIWIWENSNTNECLVIYYANADGTFSFCSNIYFDRHIVEELPATIFNEKQLREVLDFISKELYK